MEDDKRFEVIASAYRWGYMDLFEKYCKNNDTIKIRKIIKLDIIIVWHSGLYSACRSGCIDIVKFMVERRARDWNWGLSGACVGGHMDIVKLMIEKGATRCYDCKKSMEDHLK